jgi:hypothetical protein
MSEVITYKNTVKQCFCQLKLDSGERVLISIAQTGIKLFQLGLAGLLPIRTVAEWDISQIRTAIRIFEDFDAPQKPPLDAIRDKLLHCRSIADIEDLITRAT